MNKKIIYAILVIIILVIVTLISANHKSNSDVIKIGAAIPLTGNYASIGEKIKNGLDMAKADFEVRNPDVKVEVEYQDACLPKDITSAMQKLITIDRVKIVNQWCVIGLVPSLQLTEPAKVINVGIAANVSDVLGKNYYFSPNFSVAGDSKNIADFAVDTLKAKRVAFIYYNTQFGKDYRKNIGDQIVARGGTVVADEMTSLDATDFRTNLIKIKDAKPDVIFVTQLTGALGTIIKQTRDLGLTIPLAGNYQNEDPVVLSVAGKAAEGFIISSADPALLSPDSGDFRSAFFAKYAVQPDVFASNAYDAFNLEISAYLKCHGDTDCMKTELHKVSDYKGVSGIITIDKDGIASKPTVFKIVKDGAFVIYK